MDTAAEEEPNTCNPLPGHSNARYRAAYQAFLAWIEDENLSPAITEDNLLAYFVHHMTSKKASPSTLWPLYSMLKSTIILHHGIDIACYQQRLPQYIKSHIAGYQPTKAKLLSKDQVNEFLSSAPDEEYLIDKVIICLSPRGAMKLQEIYDLRPQDVVINGEEIHVVINKSRKVKILNKGAFKPVDIIRQYVKLVKAIPILQRSAFFLQIRMGKCTRQRVGKNTLGKCATRIASYLGLAEPENYSCISGKYITSKSGVTQLPMKNVSPSAQQKPDSAQPATSKAEVRSPADPLCVVGQSHSPTIINGEVQTCRLCNAVGSVTDNIFGDHPDNGVSYSLQIYEMFQIEIPDNPSWPHNSCGDCVKLLEDMKQFKNRIIETQFVLEELHQKNPPAEGPPIASVFIIGEHGDHIKEEEQLDLENSDGEASNEGLPEEASDDEASNNENGAALSGDEDGREGGVDNNGEEVSNELATLEAPKADAGLRKKRTRSTRPRAEKYKLLSAMLQMDLIKCHICSKKEGSLKELSKHCRSAHQAKVQIFCCGNSFARSSKIMEHITYHLNPDAYQCKQCHKRLTNSVSLKTHISRLHEKVYSHVCEICGKAFYDLAYLNYHRKAFHPPGDANSKDRPSVPKAARKSEIEQCDICQEWVTRLYHHKRRFHNDAPGYVELERSTWREDKLFCEKCGNYLTKQRFPSHVALCSLPKRRPQQGSVACQFCERVFRSEGHLKTHMRSHTSKRQFKCPHCDYMASTTGIRWRHIAVRHPEVYGKLAAGGRALDSTGQSGDGDQRMDEQEEGAK